MRVCMISLDAVAQPDADRLFALPALLALRRRGLFCQNVETIYPTLTYPIHTSLITGCYPDAHGIPHNQPFQPDVAPPMRAWYWDARAIRRKTLHQAAREKGLDVASILWPVSGKNRAIRRNFPEVLPLPGENAALKMVSYSSLWVLWMELLYGKQRRSIQQPDLDDYATLLCEKLYASHRPPDFLTVHLVDCDAMRHEHGVNSPEAFAAMKRLDARVGRIVAAVKKAGLLDETVFCVVSDHGQQDAPDGIPLDAWLRKACGARAQSLGMGAYIFGEDLAAARQALEENQRKWRIGRIYTPEDLRAMHAPEDVQLAVDAAPGACFIDDETITHGEHGFGLNCPEAQVFFLLAGPGVPAPAELPSMRLIDIAPTVARLLGVSLPGAQGRALF